MNSWRMRAAGAWAGLLALAAPALAAQEGGGTYGYGPAHMWGGWGWSHFVFGPLMMIAVIVAIVVVAVLLLRWLGGTTGTSSQSSRDALEILKERYARGELDRETYLRMKEDVR